MCGRQKSVIENDARLDNAFPQALAFTMQKVQELQELHFARRPTMKTRNECRYWG
jgi:hypothetical protein